MRRGGRVESDGARRLIQAPLESLKAALPVLGNPFGANDATMRTAEQFHYGFTNTLTEDAAAFPVGKQ